MTDNNSQQQTSKHISNDLKERVLTRIERDCVCPKGKWYFLCSNYTVWALWVITVIAGSIAVSESIYVSMHAGIEFFEMTHGTFTSFVIDSIPYIWLVAFAGLVALSLFNLRHTPRGYKYPLWHIIVSSVAFTVLGGVVLHAAGVSHIIDRMMAVSFPLYTSVEARQAYLWDHPEDGRITGIFVEHIDRPGEQIRFRDAVDKTWIVSVHELPQEDRTLLYSGERVRLLGEATFEGRDYLFYGCAVLPWMPKSGHSMDTLTNAREIARERMKQFDTIEAIEHLQPSARCGEIMRVVLNRKDHQ